MTYANALIEGATIVVGRSNELPAGSGPCWRSSDAMPKGMQEAGCEVVYLTAPDARMIMVLILGARTL